jgi:hypothetical protein
MFVKPRLKTTKTFLAPQRKADVAQSNAVSPAPKTIAVPYNLGNSVLDLHPHIPGLLAKATVGKKFFDV